MRSTSPRWLVENSSAWVAGGTAMATTATQAAIRRSIDVMEDSSLLSFGVGVWFNVYNIIGLDPTGRTDRQFGLGARGQLTRSFDVAARKCCLSRGKVGIGDIALAAIGHREL